MRLSSQFVFFNQSVLTENPPVSFFELYTYNSKQIIHCVSQVVLLYSLIDYSLAPLWGQCHFRNTVLNTCSVNIPLNIDKKSREWELRLLSPWTAFLRREKLISRCKCNCIWRRHQHWLCLFVWFWIRYLSGPCLTHLYTGKLGKII